MRRAGIAGALLLAACGQGGESVASAEGLQALRGDLQRRVEVDRASGLGPRLGEALRELELAHAAGGERPEYYPVRDGWLAWKAPRIFFALNHEWAARDDDSPPILAGGAGTRTVVDFARQLRERGIDLLVVPLPSRLNVYPELVVETEFDGSFAGFAPGLRRWMLELVDADVEVIDLLPALSAQRGAVEAPGHEQVFLRMNPHWTPRGLRVAVDEIGRRVEAYDWFARGSSESRLEVSSREWTHPRQVLPEGAQPAQLRLERVVDARGQAVAASDRGSPVQLLGGSFCILFEEHGADLGRALHHRWGFAPDVIASPGGAALASRRALARRDRALEGKRVVIWVFVAWTLLLEENWTPLEIVGD